MQHRYAIHFMCFLDAMVLFFVSNIQFMTYLVTFAGFMGFMK